MTEKEKETAQSEPKPKPNGVSPLLAEAEVPSVTALTKTDTALARRRSTIAKIVKPETMVRLNEAHENYFGVLNDTGLTAPERTILTAHAVTALGGALKGEILTELIMPLMNSQVGFDTDQNPDKAGNRKVYPYNETVVLACVIPAWLMGLPLLGGCWNIIAKRMYPRKEGFELLVGSHAKYWVEAEVPPIPGAMFEEGGYLQVPVKVQYRLNVDPPDDPIRTFRGTYKIRLNAKNRVGVEATQGKASRKALRDLYGILTGVLLGDGEIDESAAGIHQVGTGGGEPGGHQTKSESMAGSIVGNGGNTPPWETISPGQLKELRGLISKKTGMTEVKVATAVGHDGVEIEDLPADVFDKAKKLLA